MQDFGTNNHQSPNGSQPTAQTLMQTTHSMTMEQSKLPILATEMVSRVK